MIESKEIGCSPALEHKPKFAMNQGCESSSEITGFCNTGICDESGVSFITNACGNTSVFYNALKYSFSFELKQGEEKKLFQWLRFYMLSWPHRSSTVSKSRHGRRRPNFPQSSQHSHHSPRNQLANHFQHLDLLGQTCATTRPPHVCSLRRQPLHRCAWTPTLQHAAFTTLSLTEFHGLPIELEAVPDTCFLGFTINVSEKTITFIPPLQAWQIHDTYSQTHYERPVEPRGNALKQHTLPQLTQLYIDQGHDAQLCSKTLRSLRRHTSISRRPPIAVEWILCSKLGTLWAPERRSLHIAFYAADVEKVAWADCVVVSFLALTVEQ